MLNHLHHNSVKWAGNNDSTSFQSRENHDAGEVNLLVQDHTHIQQSADEGPDANVVTSSGSGVFH